MLYPSFLEVAAEKVLIVIQTKTDLLGDIKYMSDYSALSILAWTLVPLQPVLNQPASPILAKEGQLVRYHTTL